MRIARILILGALIVPLLAACGGGTVATTAPAAATNPAGGGGGGGGGSAVSIVDLAFNPATTTVSVGGTVTWTNDGQQPHTVQWSDGEPESEQLANGDTYERTFDTAGTFDYVCGIHPQMTGSVTVQ
jgi:plastocyanin